MPRNMMTPEEARTALEELRRFRKFMAGLSSNHTRRSGLRRSLDAVIDELDELGFVLTGNGKPCSTRFTGRREPMCGRFTQAYTWTDVHTFLNVFGAARNLRARYNVAPTTMVDVVRLDAEGRREIVAMRWGLVPFFWKKTIKEVPATFNARAETVHEKPMFRDAFKRRRCIIPASGFFEWTDEPDGKQPHFFSAADGAPILGFAGLWDRWRDPATGDELLSCTLIVSGASEWMEIYHDRMPVLLAEKDFDGWLSGTGGSEVLQPACGKRLARMDGFEAGQSGPGSGMMIRRRSSRWSGRRRTWCEG